MLKSVTDRGGRCIPGVLALPAAVALLILCVSGMAAPQTAPPQTAPPQTAPPQTAPPAAGEQAPQAAPPAAGEKAPPAPGGRQGRGPKGGRGAPPAAGLEPGDLEGVMDGIKGQMKALGAALGASNSEAALVAVTDMQRLVLLAKKYGPTNMAAVASADQPAHMVAYRKALLGVLQELVAVELNVLDGKFEAAMEQLKGPLSDMRDVAHDQFQAKEDERH